MSSPTAERTGRSSWSRWYPHIDGRRAGLTHSGIGGQEIDEPKSAMDAPTSRLPAHEVAAINASAPRRFAAALLLFVVALLTWISRGTAALAEKLTFRRGKKRPATSAPRR